MAVVRLILTAAFMVLGLFVCCVGVYGVFKLKYAANRMHAAALNDNIIGHVIGIQGVLSALRRGKIGAVQIGIRGVFGSHGPVVALYDGR